MDSSGEVLLLYEYDTDRFHRYKGINTKGNKEVVLYVERLPNRVPFNQFKAIVHIETKNDTVRLAEENIAKLMEEWQSRGEKAARHAAAYGMSKERLAQLMIVSQIESLQTQINELKDASRKRTRRTSTRTKTKKHNSRSA